MAKKKLVKVARKPVAKAAKSASEPEKSYEDLLAEAYETLTGEEYDEEKFQEFKRQLEASGTDKKSTPVEWEHKSNADVVVRARKILQASRTDKILQDAIELSRMAKLDPIVKTARKLSGRKEKLAFWSKHLDSEDEEARVIAVYAFEQLSALEEKEMVLGKVRSDPSPMVRVAAMQVIPSIYPKNDEQAVSVLSSVFEESSDFILKAEAAKALGRMGAVSAFGMLLNELESDVEWTNEMCVEYKKRLKNAMRTMLKETSFSPVEIGGLTRIILGEEHELKEDARDAVIQVLSDYDEYLCGKQRMPKGTNEKLQESVELFGRIQVSYQLASLLQDVDNGFAEIVMCSLYEMDPRVSVPSLVRAYGETIGLEEEGRFLQDERTLECLKSIEPSSLLGLLAVERKKDERTARAAIDLMPKLFEEGDENAIDSLVRHLKIERNPFLFNQTVNALKHFKPRQLFKDFAEALLDPEVLTKAGSGNFFYNTIANTESKKFEETFRYGFQSVVYSMLDESLPPSSLGLLARLAETNNWYAGKALEQIKRLLGTPVAKAAASANQEDLVKLVYKDDDAAKLIGASLSGKGKVAVRKIIGGHISMLMESPFEKEFLEGEETARVAIALGEMGEAAEDYLKEMLEKGDGNVRRLALSIILHVPRERLVDPVIKALKDCDEEEGGMIEEILSKDLDYATKRYLQLEELSKNAVTVEGRQYAVRVIMKIGAVQAIPELIAHLGVKGKSEEKVIAEIEEALKSVAEKSFGPLCNAVLNEKNDELTRTRATALLSGLFPEGKMKHEHAIMAVDCLINAAEDASPDVRNEAVVSMGEIKSEYARITGGEKLLDKLRDRSTRVQSSAYDSLQKMCFGQNDPRTVDYIRRLIYSKDDERSKYAINEVSKNGWKELIPDLLAISADPKKKLAASNAVMGFGEAAVGFIHQAVFQKVLTYDEGQRMLSKMKSGLPGENGVIATTPKPDDIPRKLVAGKVKVK